ncbi:MAG: hypothetical protein IT494_03100, partial [Gammaproteobacteria bacterium]|nr:hypothetical protein [Gammaproteobacteria bacterium]
ARAAIFSNYRPGEANPDQHPRKYVYLITPDATEAMAALGYDRQTLREYIYDATSVPFEQLSPDEIARIKARLEVSREGRGLLADQLPPDRVAVWQQGLQAGGKVPLLTSPADIHFVVAGGAGDMSVTGWSYMRGVYTWSSHRTTKITGATLTQAGH